MDKDKLFEWIDKNTEAIDLEDFSSNMIYTSDLIEAIQNGEFYKESCKAIDNKTFDEHSGHSYSCSKCNASMIGITNYCHNCGRKLKK